MRYFITGGTGTLGTALARYYLDNGHEVVIYSRDEFKQGHMAREMDECCRIKYIVGDIRDGKKLTAAMRDCDYVIHAAAIKHVPVAERDPEEAIKTNIIGTMNVIYACKKNRIKKAVLTATDKACHPVNAYGVTKAMGEKLFVAANQKSPTIFVVVRYGNVVGSRGSIIETIRDKKPAELNITDKRMTRFWISVEQAVNLVNLALEEAKPGEIIVPKAPALSVYKMFKILAPDTKLNITGMRPGEKLHESMINKDESIHTKVYKDHFVIEPELYGVEYSDQEFEYTSENCRQLTEDEFLALI